MDISQVNLSLQILAYVKVYIKDFFNNHKILLVKHFYQSVSNTSMAMMEMQSWYGTQILML